MTLSDLPPVPERPKLRLVEPAWVLHMGQRYLYLRDPMQVSVSTVMVPESVAPLLAFLDGQRTVEEITSALALRVGLSLTDADVRTLVGQLDQALMIENGEYGDALRRAIAEYRSAEHRPTSHAGAVYPKVETELESAISEWCERFPAEYPATRPDGDLVGMVCPHIDYNRGHATYAKLLRQAAGDLDEVETVVVLGTDHYGAMAQVSPTRQSYATPYGTLKTDLKVVDDLADAIGETAYREELHHTTEHSIELALVWLHHFMRDRDISVVPVLCGSFHGFTNTDSRAEDSETLEAVVGVLAELMRRRRTLVVAAGDLAHVGPEFGDSQPLDAVAKARLRSDDMKSIGAICAGDATGFVDASRAESDRRKICGLPPIYLMLRALGGSTGVHMGYDQCPADPTSGSVVSIVGALLYR